MLWSCLCVSNIILMADHLNGNARPNSSYSINIEDFRKRLKLFYTHWMEHKSDLWGSCDAIAVATPPASEDLRYLKSSALNIWLFGYEFPKTVMVFMKKHIHFLCSQKKASLIKTLEQSARDAVGADIVVHVKTMADDGSALMEEILRAICALPNLERSTVGYLSKETPEGGVLEMWSGKLHKSSLQLTDIANAFTELFAVKDDAEITCIRKAAHLTSLVMNNFVVPKLETIIDEEKKVSHSSLMDDTEHTILNPAMVKIKLNADDIDICYPPIFQSGGKFDLRPSALSDDENLCYDPMSVIICSIGSRYSSYCSNVARTFLIDATTAQIKAYEVLLKAHDAVVGALRPGNTLANAYKAARVIIEKETPELVPKFSKFAGTGIGLEFRESGLAISSNNYRLVKQNMVFNVSLGFHNLQNQTKNPKTEIFSLLLSDTVIVKDTFAEVLTAACSKALNDAAYSLKDEEDAPGDIHDAASNQDLSSKATLRSDNLEMPKEELRRQDQAELVRQKNEETVKRFAGLASAQSLVRTPSELIACKNVNVLYSKEPAIRVDQKNGAEEEDSEDSKKEKGKTWKEMEREATNADREMGDESESEEEKQRRKGKSFGKSRIPARVPKKPKFK